MGPLGDIHKLKLDATEWQLVRSSVPIACADVVVTRTSDAGTEVALVERKYRHDRGTVWCHIGGRVGIDEDLRSAALRHLETTFVLPENERSSFRESFPGVPVAFFEFFRREELRTAESGLDPDKHAISWCYQVEWPYPGVPDHVGDEAMAVGWFPVSALPDSLWPGTAELVARVTATRFSAETYASISSQADTHNSLLWQTPVLAMTAQAFLFAIGLGPEVTVLARLAAAGLGLVVSILSIQLMLKHRAMLHRDSVALERIERTRGMAVHHVTPVFLDTGLTGRLIRAQSHRWWLAGMGVFGMVSLAIAVTSLLGILR